MFNKIVIWGFGLFISSQIFCQNKLHIIDRPINKGRHITSVKRPIRAIIIHSSYNYLSTDKYNISKIVQLYSFYRVGAHYLISREGQIYRLVDEKNVAYHAGHSILPDGERSVNFCSIGIELANDSVDKPTQQQLKSLIKLVKDIQSRYNIQYILRHADIAPFRKTDPWNLDWKQFLHEIRYN